MATKILFVDRDGTLVEEPDDNQVDAAAKVRLMPGVIPALLSLKSAGYEFVIVSNQDGLGTEAFQQADFDAAHSHILALFESQGIQFKAEYYCPHLAADGCECRKPRAGLIRDFLASCDLDRGNSAVIGDRDTDLELAANIGLRGFRIVLSGSGTESWPGIARELLDQPRRSTVTRRTNETNINVQVDLDNPASPVIATGIGFFDHMLEQLGKHGGFELNVRCDGDLQVDEHHTVEDVALAVGEALRVALGDKRGIQRYGFVLPMDESEAQISIDLGGRPYLVFEGEFPRDRVGELPTELVEHFFRSLSETLGAAIHIRIQGDNAHHMVEACFKGVARTFRQAFRSEGDELPSTKGVL
jgi:imidazoleglycerol-phosphate dehydratase/histidinol-phosphatase